jgi:hypothetical protein
MPFHRDLRTNGTGDGIFTSGGFASPNRIFGILWNTPFFVSADTAQFGVIEYFAVLHPKLVVEVRRLPHAKEQGLAGL